MYCIYLSKKIAAKAFLLPPYQFAQISHLPKKVGAKELKFDRWCLQNYIKAVDRETRKSGVQTCGSLHMTFIKDRRIIDIIPIANECVDARVKSKKLGTLCKLDIEKAYDHLNWDFLLRILLNMSFGGRLVSMIKFCISKIKFSIL